jgi:putative ABC transport system ATP-binding protein
VAIARAIVNDPAVVLADEPTGNLDQKSSEQIMDLFREINRNGSTILLITHDHAVARAASRIVVIENGQLTETITRVAS